MSAIDIMKTDRLLLDSHLCATFTYSCMGCCQAERVGIIYLFTLLFNLWTFMVFSLEKSYLFRTNNLL